MRLASVVGCVNMAKVSSNDSSVGGIIGGSLTQGTLKVGDEIEIGGKYYLNNRYRQP